MFFPEVFVSSGLKAISADDAANPLGWRVANAVAIAAPYLLGGVLFVVLYLQRPSPPVQAALSTPPASAADSSNPSEPVVAHAATPAAPGSPRTAAPPAPASPARSAAGPAASSSEPPLPTQPVAVDPDIAGTMKISGNKPAYPHAANLAHIEGVVVVTFIVGPKGAVQSAQPVSGPALLEVAALDAVRTWRYRPYLVYGKPVAFQTQVSINFEIDDAPQ